MVCNKFLYLKVNLFFVYVTFMYCKSVDKIKLKYLHFKIIFFFSNQQCEGQKLHIYLLKKTSPNTARHFSNCSPFANCDLFGRTYSFPGNSSFTFTCSEAEDFLLSDFFAFEVAEAKKSSLNIKSSSCGMKLSRGFRT